MDGIWKSGYEWINSKTCMLKLSELQIKEYESKYNQYLAKENTTEYKGLMIL